MSEKRHIVKALKFCENYGACPEKLPTTLPDESYIWSKLHKGNYARHIFNYLPYNLKAKVGTQVLQVTLTGTKDRISFRELVEEEHQPILKSLSSLSEEDLSYFTEDFRTNLSSGNFKVELVNWSDLKFAFMHNLDVFNLIKMGYAIEDR